MNGIKPEKLRDYKIKKRVETRLFFKDNEQKSDPHISFGDLYKQSFRLFKKLLEQSSLALATRIENVVIEIKT